MEVGMIRHVHRINSLDVDTLHKMHIINSEDRKRWLSLSTGEGDVWKSIDRAYLQSFFLSSPPSFERLFLPTSLPSPPTLCRDG